MELTFEEKNNYWTALTDLENTGIELEFLNDTFHLLSLALETRNEFEDIPRYALTLPCVKLSELSEQLRKQSDRVEKIISELTRAVKENVKSKNN